MKAFESCRVDNFNLSYKSLTSHKIQQEIQDLKKDNPEFWQELTQSHKAPEPDGEETGFDNDCNGDTVDDSMIPLDIVIEHICKGVSPDSIGLMDSENGLIAVGICKGYIQYFISQIFRNYSF